MSHSFKAAASLNTELPLTLRSVCVESSEPFNRTTWTCSDLKFTSLIRRLQISEALAQELDGTGVSVTVLCPGPTETNFSAVARGQRVRTTSRSKMSAEDVARIGYSAFRATKVISIPGLQNKTLVQLVRFLPRSAVRQIISRYNKIKDES